MMFWLIKATFTTVKTGYLVGAPLVFFRLFPSLFVFCFTPLPPEALSGFE
jgi:hypothetical protein